MLIIPVCSYLSTLQLGNRPRGSEFRPAKRAKCVQVRSKNRSAKSSRIAKDSDGQWLGAMRKSERYQRHTRKFEISRARWTYRVRLARVSHALHWHSSDAMVSRPFTRRESTKSERSTVVSFTRLKTFTNQYWKRFRFNVIGLCKIVCTASRRIGERCLEGTGAKGSSRQSYREQGTGRFGFAPSRSTIRTMRKSQKTCSRSAQIETACNQ